jgi:hypothetical protein
LTQELLIFENKNITEGNEAIYFMRNSKGMDPADNLGSYSVTVMAPAHSHDF